MKKQLLIPFALALATFITACGMNSLPAQPQTAPASSQQVQKTGSRILIAYFSRYGNTEYPQGIDASTSASIVDHNGKRLGTTELMARTIQQQVHGDIFLIHSAAAYPTDFDAVVDQNHREIAQQAFPALTDTLDMSDYDIVFIGYPVWANTIPRPVASFIQQANLSGKIVIPFCTHAGYRSGRSYSDIKNLAAGAAILDGIDIEASAVPSAQESIANWIHSLQLEQYSAKETADGTVSIQGHTLRCQWDTTPLAREIRANLPVTVSMLGYGGREYYGSLPLTPASSGEGKRNFENGDITYCPQNNSIAIFYAQTDRPNLTMDVIKIGKVTDDLSVFHHLESTVSMTFQ